MNRNEDVMKKFLIWSGGTALIFAATAVIAAPSQGPMKMDMDASGTITKAEAMAGADARFAKMDADGNGQLDAADMSARTKAHFTKMDADKNGSISEAEFMAAHAAMMGGLGEDKGGYDGRHMGRMGHDGDRMAMVDTNGDKIISKTEFTAAAQARFAKKDKDNNGVLSGDELKHGKGMRGKWGGPEAE
jgi:Ca2+-binding EF-hand superfamily protein